VVSAAFAIAMATSASAQDPRSEDIKRWLGFYDTAFSAKDLTRLAGFYHPDVTIYEGGSVNTGWVDYRDHHLGPEVEEMQSPTLSHSDVTVHMLDKEGGAAYVTSEYRLKTRIKDRDIDAAGLETLIVVKGSEGAWKIRHSHTSSRRRPASPAPPPPGAGRD
jgi:ketosteroid isomerase-like protein